MRTQDRTIPLPQGPNEIANDARILLTTPIATHPVDVDVTLAGKVLFKAALIGDFMTIDGKHEMRTFHSLS